MTQLLLMTSQVQHKLSVTTMSVVFDDAAIKVVDHDAIGRRDTLRDHPARAHRVAGQDKALAAIEVHGSRVIA